jgi:hypothetical protein
MSASEMSKPQPKATASPLLSAYAERSCIGFVLQRGRNRFEAFDVDEPSLPFATANTTASAILLRVSP